MILFRDKSFNFLMQVCKLQGSLVQKWLGLGCALVVFGACRSGPALVNESRPAVGLMIPTHKINQAPGDQTQGGFMGDTNEIAIKGRVFQLSQNIPVPIGRVELQIESEKKLLEPLRVQTEANGEFTVRRSLPKDTYRVFVVHPKFYGQLRIDLNQRPDLEVMLEAKPLDPLADKVLRHEGTEPAFKNEYWDSKKSGIYVERISGEVLFSSKHKYDSGTGWPSFFKPLVAENIVYKEDRSWLSVRTEVRSRRGNHHLGHVFDDGPQPTGKRYCMNSAALRFIPVEKLVEEGYSDWVTHFKD